MDQWIGFLGGAALWVKAAHIIFVIFFIASLFMMPRFFIYHHQCAVGSDEDRLWIERENRLRRIIVNPSIILVWLLGLMLAMNGGYWTESWFIAKLVLVTLLSAYHGWMIGYAKKLAAGKRILSDKRLRLMNEVPGIMTALIVILVVVRP